MGKKIAKETIIILLLILAIILILGVLFYDYSPAKKVLPEKVAYTTPENVVQELATGNSVDSGEVVMTYEVNADDIKNYKKVNQYVAGKKNPFASIEQNTENTTTGTTTNNGNTNKNTTATNTNTNATSNNTIENNTQHENTGYVPDKGTK